MMKLEEQALTNITDPHDTDVLSARGGAVNRHPGNKNYLNLVHLNKDRYTTCPAVEKHMISRSIVFAIRELRGRFLEKNKIDGTWSDIGNKKATEKTSQALRERQSEMRQNISGALEESHFAIGFDSAHMSGMRMDAFLGGADISANDHSLSLEQRQDNNRLLLGMIPRSGNTIGCEPAHWIMSDFSLMSGMSMNAFLYGTLNHTKRNVSNLNDGMNPDTDRRQVFPGMKSIRDPSIGEPREPNGPVSEMTMDGALDVNPVESTLSLHSIMSTMSID
jgi:hypothetical protein